MKNNRTISVILVSLVFIFAGCKTEADKNQDAIDDVTEAKEELTEAQKEARIAEQNLLESEEWLLFKNEAYLQIKKNETDIEILRLQKAKSGRTFDTLYEKRINQLEADNNKLNLRLSEFEKNQSDWEKFKLEFNNDMNTLGNALKNLTVDNSK
jgi:hypothetical protein